MTKTCDKSHALLKLAQTLHNSHHFEHFHDSALIAITKTAGDPQRLTETDWSVDGLLVGSPVINLMGSHLQGTCNLSTFLAKS